MAFSGALTLTDLNDYITPSQACIKPVEQTNKSKKVEEPGAAATEIRIDSKGGYYEVSKDTGVSAQKLQTADISLNDCLACSGCITSAESVLITLQSHTEVLSFLAANPPPSSPEHKIPVISIAPQSLASLAASLATTSSAPAPPLQTVLERVRAFCMHELGFEHVYDTTFARHLALLEHIQEFEERQRGEAKLPMLASACPGWICYAEKTHAEMLPFIARTKSPQQVMGTLVKEWLGAQWGKRPNEIYHVAVMPCYDKKLEASRQDFYNDLFATRDVDCVLTTTELERLMREKGWDLAAPPPTPPIPCPPPEQTIPDLLTHPGTASGSYLHTLLAHHIASSPDPLTLSTKTVRSADYEEYTLARESDGAPVFRAAKCYGFRNLQNVVRKVARGAGVQAGRGAAGRLAQVRKKRAGEGDERAYDYVEVMACPGGCVNGGGQLRPTPEWLEAHRAESAGAPGVLGDNARWGDRAWTREVERAYWGGQAPEFEVGLPTPPASPGAEREVDRLAGRVLMELCAPEERCAKGKDEVRWGAVLDAKAEERRRALFRTEYRAVESEVIGLAVKW